MFSLLSILLLSETALVDFLINSFSDSRSDSITSVSDDSFSSLIVCNKVSIEPSVAEIVSSSFLIVRSFLPISSSNRSNASSKIFFLTLLKSPCIIAILSEIVFWDKLRSLIFDFSLLIEDWTEDSFSSQLAFSSLNLIFKDLVLSILFSYSTRLLFCSLMQESRAETAFSCSTNAFSASSTLKSLSERRNSCEHLGHLIVPANLVFSSSIATLRFRLALIFCFTDSVSETISCCWELIVPSYSFSLSGYLYENFW